MAGRVNVSIPGGASGGDRIEWPQSTKPRYLIISIISAFLFLFLSARVVQRGDSLDLYIIPALLIALVSSVLCVYVGFVNFGFHHIGISPRIRIEKTPIGESGILIPARNFRAILRPVLSVGALYGLSSAWMFHIGNGDSLLPSGRNTQAGANFMAVCGTILLIALFGMELLRSSAGLILSPSGFIWFNHRGRISMSKNREVRILWNEMTDISSVDSRRGEAIYSDFIVEIAAPSNILVKSKSIKSLDKLSVPIGSFVAEPNALINLMRFLKDNPGHRSILADPDARELLRPLPLFERFRQAKEVKRLESEAKKAKKAARKNGG